MGSGGDQNPVPTDEVAEGRGATLCLVVTQPVGGREREYHEWYDNQHVRDVVRVPGILSAQRFDAVESGPADESAPSRFLAVYEIAGDPGRTVEELQRRFGTPEMPASDALDLREVSMTFWSPRGERTTEA
jgi:hypothetical protein